MRMAAGSVRNGLNLAIMHSVCIIAGWTTSLCQLAKDAPGSVPGLPDLKGSITSTAPMSNKLIDSAMRRIRL